MSALSSPQAISARVTANPTVLAAADAVCASAPKAAAGLSDAELEAHIEDLGKLMLAAYARYEASGCFSDRGEADRWRIERDAAIRARSPMQQARMTAEIDMRIYGAGLAICPTSKCGENAPVDNSKSIKKSSINTSLKDQKSA